MLFHVLATPAGGDNELTAGRDFLYEHIARKHAEYIMQTGIPVTVGGTVRANYVRVIDDAGATYHELFDEAE